MVIDKRTLWSIQAGQTATELSNIFVHYDSQQQLIVSCDASQYGLGPVLAHRMDDNSKNLCIPYSG